MKQSSIGLKLVLAASAAILIILTLSNWLVSRTMRQAIADANAYQLREMTTLASAMLESYDDALRQEADNMVTFLIAQYPDPFTIDGTMTLGSDTVPVLKSGTHTVNLQFDIVDRMTAKGQANATMFVRRGDDFVRVATSVKKQNGERALGTTLSRESPAYAHMLKGEPYTGRVPLFGREFIANYTPIKDSAGKVIGVYYVGIDFTNSLKQLKQRLGQIKIGTTGYIYALDATPGPNLGVLTIHPQLEGKNLLDQKDSTGRAFIREMVQMKSGGIDYMWANPNEAGATPRSKLVQFQHIPAWNWIVAAGTYHDELDQASDHVSRASMLATAITILILGVLIFLLARHMITVPLRLVTGHLRQIAQGNYREKIESLSTDEIGQVLQSLQATQQEIRAAVGQISHGADAVAQSADQMLRSSQGIAQGSREQSEAAASMAAAVEQLTVSIDHVAQNAGQARDLSNAAGKLSEEGAAVIEAAMQEMHKIADTVRQSSDNIQDLGQRTDQIASIVNVIKEIADQTNLLALNAAIEAARAGEQGRGFAVVADEVRKLAERTTSSTLEIGTMTTHITQGTQGAVQSMQAGVTQVDTGVTLAQRAATSIVTIKDGTAQVNHVISDISAALREQSIASVEVAKNVERIAQMAEQNTRAVDQAAAASHELSRLAESLKASIRNFRV